MNAEGFLRDLETKPAHLRRLADAMRSGVLAVPDLGDVDRVLFTGMGSSRFAALPVAARLRARGVDAAVELASLETPHPAGARSLVVGISASGGTPETVRALRRRAPGTTRLAVTNADGDLAAAADSRLDLLAGVEQGQVASRTFGHTLAVLLLLAERLRGDGLDVAALCERAAVACEDLLFRRDAWLPPTVELLAGDAGTYLIAPAERRSSAEQGALMLREGPRRQADACETGDWLHVDVYLSLPLDYRCLLFTGSRFDAGVLDWLRQRDGTCVAVGGEVDGAALTVRYAGDDDPLVALLAEVLIPELVAATWWRQQVAAAQAP